jgi:spermidine/putrescine-binding protein
LESPQRRRFAMGLDDAQFTRRDVLVKGGATLASLGAVYGLSGAAARAGTAAAAALGTIDYTGYAEYALQKTMGAWEKKQGIRFNTNPTAFDGELIAKFLSGGGGTSDLISYVAVNGGPIWATGKILTPLANASLPNRVNLWPYFRAPTGGFWMTPTGQRYAVPFNYATLGITYDSAAISEPKAWSDLLDAKYKGRIGINGAFVANLDVACRILGYKPSTLVPDQVSKVKELLKRYLGQARSVSPTYGDLTQQLLSGEIVAVFPGDPALNGLAAAAGKKTIVTNMQPKEGSASFAICFAIPQTTDNPKAAYAFMNQLLDPKTNAAAAVELGGGSPTVKGAWNYLPANLKALFPANPHALLGNNPILASPPFQSSQYLTLPSWSQQWQQLVAGG